MSLRLALACLLLAAFVAAAPALAQDDPPEADVPAAAGEPITGNEREARLDRLFDKLASATTPEDAKRYETTIDELWGHSGSDTADLLTMRAEELVAGEDQAGAMKLL